MKLVLDNVIVLKIVKDLVIVEFWSEMWLETRTKNEMYYEIKGNF